MSLFSVFDPCVMMFNIQWVVLIVIVMMMISSYFYLIGGLLVLMNDFKLMIGDMFKGIVFPNFKVLYIMGLFVFIYIYYINFCGLFPYIFSGTSHPYVTLGMGLVLWMSCFLMGWIKSFKVSAAHLTPEGSPIVLAPVLVVIESMSHLIRPFTLSIRLAANMMAGHLIVSLLSSISIISLFSGMVSVFIQMMILFLEVGVVFIQGVVFSILFLLYAVEYY